MKIMMIILALAAGAAFAGPKSVASTKVINLTTVKNYAGNKVVVVYFDPTSTVKTADNGTTCTYPSTGGMFFLLKLEDGDAFARAQLAMLLAAQASGSPVSLYGNGTCQGSEEYLQDLAVHQ